MLTLEKGNLLSLAASGEFDAIMHGCNCFHGGDSGIAGQIWGRFPEAYYGKLENHEDGSWDVLGHISAHRVSTEVIQGMGEDFVTETTAVTLKKSFQVINAYTQYLGGADFYMSALVNILRFINITRKGKTIGIPKIGCGIGGGNWETVELALLTHAPDVNWRVIIWKP